MDASPERGPEPGPPETPVDPAAHEVEPTPVEPSTPPSGEAQPEVEPSTPPPTTAKKPDGPAASGPDDGCRTDADCQAGAACVGPGLSGCGGAPGRCEPNSKCTRDAKTFCGCDGVTFRASSSCPGKEYAHEGECRAKKGAPDGADCLSGDDCRSGICEGRGCGPKRPGKCMAKDRQCTADAIPYCGCDHQAFRASSKCPNRRYRNEGACHR